ncbi:MAG: hypothetical protein CME63_14230 [Halobacteriovoraceae bacterium]|nr:hypothetical protein [Halobacteriovoraceae bacterium]MBC98898.1 hypothetical protein [Halobacteriovoraceae bacterium]|tara:strand:- start:3254 stop:4069 length:816 start_codon:yes stop_codon:yes gene_type:complete
MRIVLLFTLLLTSFKLSAQVRTSYYPYEEKPIELSDRSFHRYIMPQLKAISQEYFHILRKLNPVHSETIELFTKVMTLNHAMSGINKICQESLEKCEERFKKANSLARSLDLDIANLQAKHLKLVEPKELEFASSLDQLSLENYKLIHKIEEHLITLNTDFSSSYYGKSLFQPIVHKMLLDSEFMLTQMLGGTLKDDFDSVWVGFFKEVNQRLIYEKDKIYLLKRLEELNLSWNTFHMKMTKGNHDLPPHLIKLIKVMHNRWNSCLKVILM